MQKMGLTQKISAKNHRINFQASTDYLTRFLGHQGWFSSSQLGDRVSASRPRSSLHGIYPVERRRREQMLAARATWPQKFRENIVRGDDGIFLFFLLKFSKKCWIWLGSTEKRFYRFCWDVPGKRVTNKFKLPSSTPLKFNRFPLKNHGFFT